MNIKTTITKKELEENYTFNIYKKMALINYNLTLKEVIELNHLNISKYLLGEKQ